MTSPTTTPSVASTGDPLTRVTYWLKHNGHFVATVLAAPGLPARTVRFLALHEFDRVPLHDLPEETPVERRRKISNSTVHVFDDSTSDLFAETVRNIA